MSPHLYVVFYRPRYGNYQHWALQLESDTDSIIFEVVGQHPTFERNVLEVQPERSGSFIGKLYVGVLSESDIQRVKNAARLVPVDNETIEWDCQDYVFAAGGWTSPEYFTRLNHSYQSPREAV